MAATELIKTIRYMLQDKETPLDPVVADRLTLALLVDLSESVLEDHDKVTKMWNVYQFNVWLIGGLGVGFIALIFSIVTGQAQIIFG